jgi:membrane-bound metal-dependent hydrolase YbcI (DUF457 family)
MPFTPYHLGPALLIGVLFIPFCDFSTIFIASVILDLEPLAILLLNLPLPLHGFFHTYVGATIIAGILAFSIWPFRNYLNAIVSLFGIHQVSTLRTIIPASIIGTYTHIFLDSFVYAEMNPLYPLIGNPFFELVSSQSVYSLCVFSGFLGLAAYLAFILYTFLKPKATQEQLDVFEQNNEQRILKE